jgi:CarD family transcriptional regulator
MFFIGDVVFYPFYGAGCIINIEEKEIYNKVSKYYIIKLINGMGIMVPVNSDESKKLRKAISVEECMRLFEILRESPEKLPSKWSERYKHYNHAIKSGNIFKMVCALRDITGLSRKKELSKSEIKIFNDILNMVSGEIALVLNMGFDDVRMEIIDVLNRRDNICS